ncbi:MAG: hypothetical protein AB7F28_02010 [Candidatus Margulisiibacteriota bacterium]
MNKQFLASILTLLLCTSVMAAPVAYRLEDFEGPGVMGNAGLVNVQGNSLAKVGISPDLALGPIEVGFDMNAYIPLNGATVPAELQWFSLRHVGFDFENVAGLKWGRLTNVTYGYGLVMDHYDSGAGGSGEFTTDKAGVKGYLQLDPIRVDAMVTAKNLKAARLSYLWSDSFLLNWPLAIGTTYVTDDGVSATPVPGNSVTRPQVSALGVDLAFPVGGDFLTFYLEGSQLMDKDNAILGRGASAGMKGDLMSFFEYRAEYRRLGAGFVPGYFGQDYEASSFTFPTDAPQKDINGFLISAGAQVNDIFKVGLGFEGYDDRAPLLTGALGWHSLFNTVGVINYSMPFQAQGNHTLSSTIHYKTGGAFDYIVSVKREYVASGAFNETVSVGTQVNLTKAFGLPF